MDMTVGRLRELIRDLPDDEKVHIEIDQPYIREEMDEIYPGWENDLIINFDVALWDH